MYKDINFLEAYKRKVNKNQDIYDMSISDNTNSRTFKNKFKRKNF